MISGRDLIDPVWDNFDVRVDGLWCRGCTLGTFLWKAFDEAAKYATCVRFWCPFNNWDETEDSYKSDFNRFKDAMKQVYTPLPEE